MMDKQSLQLMAHDPGELRARLLVDTDDGPRLLSAVMDEWQREDFEALDAGWRRAAGHKVEGGHSRGWLERPRGHSKTSDIAVMACWALAFAKRRLSGVVAAADKDQASLLRQAIDRLLALNPWLRTVINPTKYSVTGRHGSRLEIISSDALTSFGRLCDFVVCDELCHWKSSGLWESLFSAAAKRKHCMLLCISNAGFQSSWQWPIREAIREDPNWYFSRLDGPRASWISEELLAEQERLLPKQVYRRLWLNQWSSGAGDALTETAIEAAVSQRGPMSGYRDGFTFVAGLDLGVRRDHSGLVVIGCDFSTGRVRLADCQSWRPGPDGEVDLLEVQQAVLAAHQRFHLVKVLFDPYQAELMAQQLRRYGLNMQPVNFVGSNLHRMATAMLEAFEGRKIDLYPDKRLLRDLRRLTIVEKRFGFKLESTRDSEGHADTAIALAMALPHATRTALANYTGGMAVSPYRHRVRPPRERIEWGVQLDTSNRR
ncbi:MAG: terminase [Planctomycetales bacterium]|nr:terminase [Planctomycetales bacterium]